MNNTMLGVCYIFTSVIDDLPSSMIQLGAGLVVPCFEGICDSHCIFRALVA